MADRADLIGKSFVLPQIPAQGAGTPAGYGNVQAPSLFNDGVTEETGLASVEGLTTDYYRKVAMLKGLMQDAWENYRIDVRVPDLSKPESIKLNQMYQKAIADIKTQGNLLKNSQSMLTAGLGRNDRFITDPTKAPVAGMRPGVDYAPDEIHPAVVEINNKLQQQFYGKSYDQAVKLYDDKVQELKTYAEAHPEEREQVLRSIAALTKPTKAEKEFDTSGDTGFTKTDMANIKAVEQDAKKVAAVMSGATKGFKLKTDEKGPSGEPLFGNTDLAGVNYADGVIVETIFNPTTDQTTFKVKVGTGDKASIKSVDMTGKDVVTVLKELSSQNPRFAAAGQYASLWAQQSGLADPNTGEIFPEALVGDAAVQAKERFKKESESELAKSTDAEYKKIESELTQLEPRVTALTYKLSNGNDYVLPNGGTLNIKRSGDNEFVITNFKEAFPQASDKQKKQLHDTKLPLSEILKFLRKSGAKSTTVGQTGTTPAATNRKDVL